MAVVGAAVAVLAAAAPALDRATGLKQVGETDVQRISCAAQRL